MSSWLQGTQIQTGSTPTKDSHTSQASVRDSPRPSEGVCEACTSAEAPADTAALLDDTATGADVVVSGEAGAAASAVPVVVVVVVVVAAACSVCIASRLLESATAFDDAPSSAKTMRNTDTRCSRACLDPKRMPCR
jgi:hypothetical protein